MHFLLYEIVARVVAIYLAVDCIRRLKRAQVERKIAYYSPDFLDWWSSGVVHRDAAPVRFWIVVCLQITALVACVVVAIFGWLQPNT